MSVFKRADILLPQGCDLKKWSVVACDQFTSQPEYWNDVEKIVSGAPSTYNLVFPEAFLSEGQQRIDKINTAMHSYVSDGIFTEHKNSLIYVERRINSGKIRRGIVGMIDLEKYDFSKGSKSSVRATEGTVLERIPPRVKIRENAILELPHIILLIDDAEKKIIETVKKGECVYDFELMKNGGRLSGYLIDDKECSRIISLFDELEKCSEDNLSYAVGDGNHSLATAKTCWENLKRTLTKDEIEKSSARYCLVEVENIHDDALEFEPIHRVCFNADTKRIEEKMHSYFDNMPYCGNEKQSFVFVVGNEKKEFVISNPPSPLTVGSLQKFIDDERLEVDYIHGEDVVLDLAKKEGCVGFILPKPAKSGLFKTVISDGALPRKTFSMGEANEKRYYMEAKKIR